MALQIDWTDEYGVQHAEAYAKISHVRLTFLDRDEGQIARVEVLLWHNIAARSKDNPSDMKRAFKDFTYVLKGSDYTTYLEDSVIKANDVSITSSLYSWLNAHNDGTATHSDTGERLDNQGNGINWTTATDV